MVGMYDSTVCSDWDVVALYHTDIKDVGRKLQVMLMFSTFGPLPHATFAYL